MNAAKAPQPSTPVNFDMPSGACDCHVHIFGPQDRFPMVAKRLNTPPLALPEELVAMHRFCHYERVVVVTPSNYGTDNHATLYGMAAFPGTARGVAVIDENTTEEELNKLRACGVRGIRLGFAMASITDPGPAQKSLKFAIDRAKAYGWHIQLYADPKLLGALKETFAAAPVTFVFDHFGGITAEFGLEQPGLADILELVRSGKAYVKIGPDRAWAYPDPGPRAKPNYAAIVPIAKAFIAANPDRIVWGTDWPHPCAVLAPGKKVTDLTPDYPIDDGDVLNQLPIWAPDAAIRQKILVTNPARLYDFPPVTN
jgi:predicted TIM-barrel fold metal-dependent hydrolase